MKERSLNMELRFAAGAKSMASAVVLTAALVGDMAIKRVSPQTELVLE